MKKILLTAAMALAAAGAYADYSDYFEIQYQGKNVENGATVICTNGEMNDKGTFDMHAELPIINKSTEDFSYLFCAMYYSDPATKSEAKGTPSFCSGTNCYPPVMSDLEHNIGIKSGLELEAGIDNNFLIHVNNIDPNINFDETYRIIVNAQEEIQVGPDEFDFDDIPDTNYVVYLRFTHDSGAVEGIDADAAATPEYFDLQGVRVDNPENGLYIVRRGAKVSKEVLRK